MTVGCATAVATASRCSAPRSGSTLRGYRRGQGRVERCDIRRGRGPAQVRWRRAAIVSDASNEEGYLVQRILREALGSPHVDSRPSRVPRRATLLHARPAEPLGQGPRHRRRRGDPPDRHRPPAQLPILDLRIRKAIRRGGARLALATERPTALDGGAVAASRLRPGRRHALPHRTGRLPAPQRRGRARLTDRRAAAKRQERRDRLGGADRPRGRGRPASPARCGLGLELAEKDGWACSRYPT